MRHILIVAAEVLGCIVVVVVLEFLIAVYVGF